MSQANLDLVAQVYRAFDEIDFTAIERLFDPDIEITMTAQLPWGGKHVGHEGATTFFGTMLSHIEAKSIPERSFAAGDDVVVIGRGVGATRQGVAFDLPQVHVWHVRDARIAGFTTYLDTPGMLAALGEAH
ncbi:nuclear transport factor 2 family protein [Nocardia brasiliensis]|uniref:nuclear transport factor 2 family protein n=1 Tax=Nocardia brasiliensis TaxID=37326 RepID=UPI0036728A07